ncbi:MAG: hypothetical protein ABR589_13650, partial [Chthoniobacterales bacterium]
AYAAQKVISSYRADESALVRFGAAVRREAAAKDWRHEVIGGKEEGLLLYLRRTRFITPAEAVERWNAGEIDALVAPGEEVAQLLNELEGAAPASLEAAIRVNDRERRYVLLKRSTLGVVILSRADGEGPPNR